MPLSPVVRESYLRPLSIFALARLRGLKVSGPRSFLRIQGASGYLRRTPISVVLHLPGQPPQPLADLSEIVFDAALKSAGIIKPVVIPKRQHGRLRNRSKSAHCAVGVCSRAA
jgi:hypothetical protein